MDGSETRRASLLPAISKLLRSRDFRSVMGGADSITAIPVVHGDTCGYVFDRLLEAHGSGAVVIERGDDVEVAFFEPASKERVAVATEDDALCDIADGSAVELLFDLMRMRDGVVLKRATAGRLVHRAQDDLVTN